VPGVGCFDLKQLFVGKQKTIENKRQLKTKVNTAE